MDNNPTLSSFDLISHPDRTLETHLNNCYDISKKIVSNKFFSESFVSKSELKLILKILVYLHDFGKASDFFQHKIIEATKVKNSKFAEINNEYINWFALNKKRETVNKLNLNERLSNHALIGAYSQFAFYKNEDSIINLILLEVIKRHHGYLRNFDKSEFWLNEEIDSNKLKDLKEQFEFINMDSFNKILNNSGIESIEIDFNIIISDYSKGRAINKVIEALKQKKDVKYFLLQHFIFSVLLSADKGDMMLKDFELLKNKEVLKIDIIDSYKKNRIRIDKTIDILREEVYLEIADNIKKSVSNSFFSITLPTGLGKTFCAYNSAIYLQNSIKEKNFRIVYCLPFTSIIDQNEKVLSEIFEYNNIDLSLICKHHHLTDYKKDYKENELTYSESEYLTEGWEQEFIVTTFVQFLESIFTNKNRSLRKFHNLVNSVIILDEVQNISPKYYNLIEVIFRGMAKYFGTKFIFVTATQPLLFQNNEDIVELTDPERIKTKSIFEKMNRITLDISLFKRGILRVEEIINIIQSDIDNNPKKSFLIIANTIKQSQAIYNSISGDFDKYYLSASILPILRKDIIDKIKNFKKRKIVVSTQVVEAGVDIDLDIVYRDFAPLDSINQSAGRCNRNGLHENGIVKIFNLGKANYIYDSTLLNITENIFKKYNEKIPENKLYEVSLEYFKQVKEKIQDFNSISEKLISYVFELQLEKLEEEFKLIKDLPIYYNVFIPFNENAQTIWKEYLSCLKEEDIFKRKEKVKKIKPKILQYITRFPKNKYSPPENQKDRKIMYEDNWEMYYDLITGFKFDILDNELIIL